MRSHATAVLLGLCLCCAAFAAVRADEADDDEPCQIPRAASRAEKCDYITEREDACEVDALLDYLHLYYCSDVSQPVAHLILAALCVWWCLLIAVLGSTADEYFCPPLTSTASWLQLRPRVAAVTLLALANGAPDVFSVQAALDQGDTLLAVGAMLGGTLFVTCLVVPAVIFCSQDRVLAGGMLFRDVTTFLVVVGLVAGLCAMGSVRVWQPCVLLVLYVLYVVAVATSHRVPPARWARSEEGSKEETAPLLPEAGAGSGRRGSVNSVDAAGGGRTGSLAEELYELSDWAERGRLERVLYVLEGPFRLARVLTIPAFIQPEEQEQDLGPARAATTRPGSQVVLVNCTQKIMLACSALGFPALVCIWVQTEVIDDDDFETAVNGIPLVGFVACVSAPLVGWLAIILWRSPDSCGFGFRARQHKRVYDDSVDGRGVEGSQPRYVAMGVATTLPPCLHRMFMVGGLVGAVLWIDIVSGEVVALLQSFGYMFDVPAALLGQTALAWGNSVGDAFANAALARQGQTKMAITGCFAAPIFNVLCGFGAALLIETVKGEYA